MTADRATNVLARMVGAKLTDSWGQQVVVENRPGAGGNIGAEAGARAAPDGYTLTLAAAGFMAVNPSVYSKLPYDSVKDFAPVSLLANAFELDNAIIEPFTPEPDPTRRALYRAVAESGSALPSLEDAGETGAGLIPYGWERSAERWLLDIALHALAARRGRIGTPPP